MKQGKNATGNNSEDPAYISDCDSVVEPRVAYLPATIASHHGREGGAAAEGLVREARIRLKVRKELQKRLETTGSLGPGASTAKCAQSLEAMLFKMHEGSLEDYAGSMRGRVRPLLSALLHRKLRKHSQEPAANEALQHEELTATRR